MVSMKILITVLAALSIACPAQAAPLVGRVFDSMEGLVFSGAKVRITGLVGSANTDRYGFFNFADVAVGAHQLSIFLADGRRLACQVLIGLTGSPVLAEFDVSRIIPPGEDDDY